MIYFYTFFALIIATFLNPQQTKFFGGLAIHLKQSGLFVKYKTAENFIYFLSWIFMIIFFKISFLLSMSFGAV
jgi:preprotein translocase subunit SecG